MNEQYHRLAAQSPRIPLFVAGIYAAIGVTYIIVSDLLLAGRTGAGSEFALWGMVKGVCYVLVTGLFLFWLVRRCMQSVEAARAGAQRRADQQAVIADLGQRAIEGAPAEQLMRDVPQQAARELQADFGALFELAPDGKSLVLRAVHGGRVDLVGTLTLAATPETQTGYTLCVNEPVIVNDYSHDSRFKPSPLALELGIVSSLTVVLRGRDRALGVLGVYAREPRQYSAEDCSFLRSLANILSHALERERAAEALRRQNELLRSVTDSAPVLLGLLDARGALVWCNREWSRLAGVAADGFEALFPDPQARMEAIRQLRTATGRWVDLMLRPADGRELRTTWTSAPLSQGAVLCIGSDVTEQRLLQDQLIQTQKLEAVGLLAGGIAHDFNNLLTAFLGYADLIRRQLAHAPPDLRAARESIDMIERTAQRAAALTRQILIYCRRDVSQPAIVDPAAVVRDMLPMLTRLLGEDIRIRATATGPVPNVRIDPGRLEQAVMNLAINARDAMSTGGDLAIETGGGSPLTVGEQSAAGADGTRVWVRIAVRDTGTGIPSDVRARIFEPFFTTKPVGAGTGMGLATVKRIVDEAGGRVEVASESGSGTTVVLWLPAAEVAAAPDPAPIEAEPSRGGGETILLCEDDDSLRELAARALGTAGYDVLSARTPERALELARRAKRPINLLVSDVVLPDMTGPALAARLGQMMPKVRVLFVSGYPAGLSDECRDADPAYAFLAKPFEPGALVARVRGLLDEPAAAIAEQ